MANITFLFSINVTIATKFNEQTIILAFPLDFTSSILNILINIKIKIDMLPIPIVPLYIPTINPIIKDNINLFLGDKSFMGFICFFTILSFFLFNFKYFFITEK